MTTANLIIYFTLSTVYNKLALAVTDLNKHGVNPFQKALNPPLLYIFYAVYIKVLFYLYT